MVFHLKKALIALVAIVVVLAVVLLLQQPTGFSTLDVQATEPVRIGVILPLTGSVATVGEYMRNGLLIAEEEINNSNGINGRPVELLFEDTVVDPKLSVSAATKFIEVDDIKVIIGDYRSPNTLAAAHVAEENKVILISPGSQSDAISEAGDYIFRTQVKANLEAKKLAEFIAIELGVKKVPMIVVNHDYGLSLEKDFKKYFAELGGIVEEVFKVNTEETDFRTIILKLKGSDSKVVVLAIGGHHGGIFANQAKEAGLERIFVASSIIQTDDLLTIGKGSVEGWMYSYPYKIENEAQQSYGQKYEERFGKESDAIAANSYDALMLIAKAMRECKEDTGCIRDWLYSVKDYQGASGILTFDSNGDVLKPIGLKAVKDGKFVPLD